MGKMFGSGMGCNGTVDGGSWFGVFLLTGATLSVGGLYSRMKRPRFRGTTSELTLFACSSDRDRREALSFVESFFIYGNRGSGVVRTIVME